MANARKAIAALVAAAMVLLAVPAPAYAEDTGIIRGTLIDANGQPLAGYKVQVTDASGAVHESEPTGADGKYEIAGLPAGTYNYAIFNPEGAGVPVRIPAVELKAGTVLNQPIAIVPKRKTGGKGPLIAWLVGGGVVAAALIIANSNDDDDDNKKKMTPGGGT